MKDADGGEAAADVFRDDSENSKASANEDSTNDAGYATEDTTSENVTSKKTRNKKKSLNFNQTITTIAEYFLLANTSSLHNQLLDRLRIVDKDVRSGKE